MFPGWRCRCCLPSGWSSVEPGYMLSLHFSGLSATAWFIVPLKNRQNLYFSPPSPWLRTHNWVKANASKITTDLALICCLCHEVCDSCKSFVELSVGSLKKQHKKGAWLERKWTKMKPSQGTIIQNHSGKRASTLTGICVSSSVLVEVWDAPALAQSTLRLEARSSTSRPKLAERHREDSSQAWLAMNKSSKNSGDLHLRGGSREQTIRVLLSFLMLWCKVWMITEI